MWLVIHVTCCFIIFYINIKVRKSNTVTQPFALLREKRRYFVHKNSAFFANNSHIKQNKTIFERKDFVSYKY